MLLLPGDGKLHGLLGGALAGEISWTIVMARLPGGLRVLLERYWDRIDKTITAKLDEIGEERYPGMTALGTVNPARDALGCGSWGCVFPIDTTPRWVVKVTTDPTEPGIVSAIMEHPYLHEHEGVVRFEGLWGLPEETTYPAWGRTIHRAAYVILREEASPLQVDARDLTWMEQHQVYSVLHKVMDKAREADRTYRGLVRAEEKGLRSVWDWRHKHDKAMHQWLQALDIPARLYWTQPIAHFMLAFFETTESILADVHGGNVGWRVHNLTDLFGVDTPQPTNRLVIMDPGHSFIPGAPIIPVIENPAFRELC